MTIISLLTAGQAHTARPDDADTQEEEAPGVPTEDRLCTLS